MAKSIDTGTVQNQKVGLFILSGTGTSAAVGYLFEADPKTGKPVPGGMIVPGSYVETSKKNSWALMFNVTIMGTKHFALRVRGWNRRLLKNKPDTATVSIGGANVTQKFAAVSNVFDVTAP